MTGPLDPPTGPNPPQSPPPGYPPPGYPSPGYPPPGYPPPGYQQAGHAAPPRAADAGRDQRIAARPQPTAGGTLAGVGLGLAVLGIAIWAGGYAVSAETISVNGSGGGDSRNWLGVVLALAVTAAGFLIAAAARTGPLATAGVTASALGVPLSLVFMTLDLTGGSPINVDAVFVVSIVVWMLSYLAIPGSRGHGFYLGLSAVALWVYVVIKIAPSGLSLPGMFGVHSVLSPTAGFDTSNDLSSLIAVSFLLAAAYYALGFILDRNGRSGAATPLIAAGFPVTVGAFSFAAGDFSRLGEGLALVVVGSLLVVLASRARRRFTTWAGGLGVLVGVVLLVQEASPNNDTAAGLLLVLAGLALAGGGVIVSGALTEREYPGS